MREDQEPEIDCYPIDYHWTCRSTQPQRYNYKTRESLPADSWLASMAEELGVRL